VAIAHQDCAWYTSRRIGPLVIDVRARQIADLKSAAARLRRMFDDVVVETYFARLTATAPHQVVFEAVA
jgi:hypothetical protein